MAAEPLHANAFNSDDSVVELHEDTPLIPNGGLKAWLQVVGAHFLWFNTWGIVNSFGVYQAYYESDLLSSRSPSEISWIGTFQGFLLVCFGIVGGPLFDYGYFHYLMVVGSLLIVVGLMTLSLATTYWQIFLAQGLCIGLGAGCLFAPSIAIVATYFSTKRALATGITAAGGSIGSVIYPIVLRRLAPQVGFPWATRVVGFIALFGLVISNLVMRTRLPPPKAARRFVDARAFRSVPFVLLAIGFFLNVAGLYIPIFYIILYAQRKIGVAEDLSFYLLAVLNASSVFGRIIPGLLADKFGSLEIMTVCTLICALLSYVLIAIHNLAGIVIFCILYGFSSGAILSLAPTSVGKLIPDLSLFGTWLGIAFLFVGTGLLIGNPIAGVLINLESNSFSNGYIFGASCVSGGTVMFTLVLLVQRKIIKIGSS
ncbi:hypothetical protein TrVFT333_004719 [Trichoderma virens FT-333]|nr:hypothetical protein TrVFT333_004719 [Trichoderma virens FT-333]